MNKVVLGHMCIYETGNMAFGCSQEDGELLAAKQRPVHFTSKLYSRLKKTKDYSCHFRYKTSHPSEPEISSQQASLDGLSLHFLPCTAMSL